MHHSVPCSVRESAGWRLHLSGMQFLSGHSFTPVQDCSESGMGQCISHCFLSDLYFLQTSLVWGRWVTQSVSLCRQIHSQTPLDAWVCICSSSASLPSGDRLPFRFMLCNQVYILAASELDGFDSLSLMSPSGGACHHVNPVSLLSHGLSFFLWCRKTELFYCEIRNIQSAFQECSLFKGL